MLRSVFPLARLLILALPALCADTARAALSFTTNAAAFNSGAMGASLSTQTFSTSSNRQIGSTLNSSNNPAILPGLNFATADGTSLYLVAPNGNASVSSGANNTNSLLSTFNPNVPIVISFGLPQQAVSLSLLGLANTGFNSMATVVPTTVTVLSTTGSFLGDFNITPNRSGTGSFLGILATGSTQIGSIALSLPSSSGPTSNPNFVNIESVSFTQGVSPTAIPEPASLLLVGLGLASCGVVARSRRRA